MRGAVYCEDLVFRQSMLVRLEIFLQPRLGVLLAAIEGRFLQWFLQQRQNHAFGRDGTTIEVDRSKQGLETVGENRGPRMPPRTELSRTELEIVSEIERSGDCCQGFPAYKGGPEATQLPLGSLWKALVQRIRDNQPEDRVAKELQPFIVYAVGTAVRQRLFEQFLRSKVIAQTTFDLAWRLPQRRTSSTLSLKEISTSTLPTIGS